jgi:hypothetical protein
MGESRGAYRVLIGNLKERNNLEELCVGVKKIILKWIFKD